MKLLILAGVLCAAAAAQTFPEPPPLVRVVRTPLADPSAPARYAQSGAMAVFGSSAMTGLAETWLVEAYASFGALEQADLAVRPPGFSHSGMAQHGGGLVSAPLSWLAVYRPWLSYRPVEATQMLSKTRYFQALVFRVDPQHEADFAEAVRVRKASLDGINLDRPEMAYQVISGAPTITYLFLAPLQSLSTYDEVLTRIPQYARATAKIAAAGNLSHEPVLLRVEPGMSVVPDDIAEGDREFWRPDRRR